MSKLPSSAAATVRQFALQMEVEPVEARDGAYSFDFERNGRLSILASEDDHILVSLTGKLLLGDIRGYARILPVSGYRAETDSLVHVGLNRAGQPVLATRVPPNRFDLPFLEQSFIAMAESLSNAFG